MRVKTQAFHPVKSQMDVEPVLWSTNRSSRIQLGAGRGSLAEASGCGSQRHEQFVDYATRRSAVTASADGYLVAFGELDGFAPGGERG